jgi:protein-tyrosine phosphatase
MEKSHLRWLDSRGSKTGRTARVRLLLSYPTGRAGQGDSLEVPDPYYGDEAEFESCLDLVQAGCAALLGELEAELTAS